MIEIPVEDLVFIVCALVGGGLLLITVLFDDILGGIFDALHIGFDIGGMSLMPLLLAFVAMFGVGGLFATQVLDVHGGQAAIVGTVFGGASASASSTCCSALLRRAEGATAVLARATSSGGGVRRASASRPGSTARLVKAEGQTHEYSATATDRHRRPGRPSRSPGSPAPG